MTKSLYSCPDCENYVVIYPMVNRNIFPVCPFCKRIMNLIRDFEDIKDADTGQQKAAIQLQNM